MQPAIPSSAASGLPSRSPDCLKRSLNLAAGAEETRDKFLKTFAVVLDFAIPIRAAQEMLIEQLEEDGGQDE